MELEPIESRKIGKIGFEYKKRFLYLAKNYGD